MCCYGIWRKYGRRFPGRKGGEETSRVACLLKRKGKTRVPKCSISLTKKRAFPLRGEAGKSKVPVLAPQVRGVYRTYS